MNQEQNSWNSNNFNTQGDNRISNDQLLNNQTFNQGMSFDQQSINPQPQLIPNYQQSIMQEHTPQHINNPLESGNSRNQNFNRKPLKKMNLGLIIGIVAVVAVVGVGIFFCSNLISKNKNDNNLSELNDEDIKITGNIELIGEYKKDEYKILTRVYEDGNFFRYVDNYNKTLDILDKNGKVLFTMDNLANISYIGDGYFENSGFAEDTFQIIDIKGNIQTFNTEYDNTFYYENDVLYYSYLNTTQAYDLKNKKVLWKVEGGINPFVLENGKIILKNSENVTNKLIVDEKTGKLVKTPDSKEIYATENAYYLVNENSIDVFDYNNKKLSSFILEENDDYSLLLETLLNTGGFVIKKYNKKEYFSNSLYTIYNKRGKEILTIETNGISVDSLFTYKYGGGIAKKQSNSKYSILKAEKENYKAKTYIIYEDDSYLELYDVSICGKYAISYVSKNDERIKIVNLETKEEKILSENLEKNFTSSKNNTYFIIKADYSDKYNNYIVYDNKYNKIYSTNNTLKVINDDYFMEIDYSKQQQSKIYLINKNTLEKKLLETKGVYDFNTSNNLVTYEFNGTKQWLYKFK